MAWLTGQQLQNGKYTIESLLAIGGFAITYLAKDLDNNCVVIKTLNDKLQKSPEFNRFQQDFVNEALRVKGCQHPHIVKVYELFQEGALWCMVMEYIQGKDLYNLVLEQGPLSEEQALVYIQQIAGALIVVHNNGLLHRDVKPQNIMIRAGTSEAVLIDFGLARKFTPNQPDSHTEFLSHGYAPLEQYFRRRPRGPYTDVYALAATLYVLLTGFSLVGLKFDHCLPSALDRDDEVKNNNKDPLLPVKQVNYHVSDRVNDAILEGMELESKNRPKSVEQWLYLLLYAQPQKRLKFNISKFLNNKIFRLNPNILWLLIGSVASFSVLSISGSVYWELFQTIPPKSLEITIKPVYSEGEGITLKKTSVCDDNGYTDIKKVHFWIKKQEDEQWKTEPNFEAIPFKLNGQCASFSYEIDTRKLVPGNYQIQAIAYDSANLQTQLIKNFAINAKPKNLKVSTHKNNYDLGEDVKIVNGEICDADGVNDLKRIDFHLSKNSADFQIKGSFLLENNLKNKDLKIERNCINFNSQINKENLQAGNYILKAIAYDRANGSIFYTSRFNVNAPPRDLKFNLNKLTIYDIGEPINIINTNICDDNGIDDLSRIYFFLRRNNGNWERLSSEITWFSSKSLARVCANFNYTLNGLSTAGNYQLYAVAEDNQRKSTRSEIKSFTVSETLFLNKNEF